MIIKSLLDNDLYKFTMQYAVITLFPRAKVRYEFINRGNTKFPNGFEKLVQREIENMSYIQTNEEELKYFQKVAYYLPPTYFDFLKGYKYDPNEVEVKLVDNMLQIRIEGYWYRTILWEVPILAIVSELYFKYMDFPIWPKEKIIENTAQKARLFEELQANFADFGTRRRYSFENHDLVIKTLKENSPKHFVGSSNVYFAYKYQLTPIGTQAHEWIMFHAAKYGFEMANKLAMENWVKIYRGDLGIALSDTFTSEAFFRSFDTKLAKLFDGVRQDSGDPFVFGDRLIEHYKKCRIDPTTKTIIFSDQLNPEMVKKLVHYFRGKIRFSFGIGTNLTNDVGVEPLNIVIKLSEAMPEGRCWTPTVKLSDSKGKYTGDIEMINIAKKILNIHD